MNSGSKTKTRRVALAFVAFFCVAVLIGLNAELTYFTPEELDQSFVREVPEGSSKAKAKQWLSRNKFIYGDVQLISETTAVGNKIVHSSSHKNAIMGRRRESRCTIAHCCLVEIELYFDKGEVLTGHDIREDCSFK